METPTTETPTEVTETVTPETPSSYSLLAQKHFKDGYVGEPAEQPVHEVEEEVAETEEPAETAEPEVQEETEEVVVSSFDDLITSQEWDSEWADSLTFRTKVDGEEANVTLADMKASYQTQQAANKRLEEAKAAKESAKAEAQKETEAAKQQLVVAASLIAEAEKELQGEFDDTNFKELEKIDPAEAALKKIQFQEKRQNLDALKKKALTEYQKAVTQNQEKAKQALFERLQQEGEALVEKIPEWKNEDTAKADKAKVSQYLSDLGFSDQEISQAYDHRMIVLARKAMLHDEGVKKLEPAKQKLKVVKKTIPPGSKKTPTQIHSQRKNQLKSDLKKTGSFDAALKILKGS